MEQANPAPLEPKAPALERASWWALANERMQAGDAAGAAELCARMLAADPQDGEAAQLMNSAQHALHIQAAQAAFPGAIYLDWLRWFHDTLRPANYLEIGVESGASLCFAKPPTRAVGVDPAIQVVHGQEAWCKLFKLTSDEFFAKYDLRRVLQAETLDLAFIDGLHTFDQALKDFMNIERYSCPATVVLFHDVWPVTAITAARERVTTFWPGDTWKVIPILRERRPGLKVFTIPTFPSGLGVVTGLDANDESLWPSFAEIVEQWLPVPVENYLPEMAAHLNAVRNDYVTVSRLLRHY